MIEGLDRTAAADNAAGATGGLGSSGRVPMCFVVDEDGSIRHFLSLILHGAGVDAREFVDGKSLAQAVAKNGPDLIFLNIGIESTEAIEAILMLARRGYSGFVQLMSNRARRCWSTSRASATSTGCKCCRS
jgi:chemotaxis response regulator CheB